MYGDCQVLSSMGGNGGATSESFFSSPIQNPNFNFMAMVDHNMPFQTYPPIMSKEEMGGLMRGKQEMESGSDGSEPVGGGGVGGLQSGNEQEITGQPPKKKRYYRHTARQIQEMEALFKECPHPDDKQRLRLGQQLGLKPRQVKFWFQNRRTQMKAQQDRQENALLRAENENLRYENYQLQSALRGIVCPNCGGPAVFEEMAYDEHLLRIENARLKEEFERVCCVASRYSGQPIQAMGSISPPLLLAPPMDLDMSIIHPNPNCRHFQNTISNCTDTLPAPLIPENPHLPPAGGGSGRGLIMEEEEEKLVALEHAMSAVDELVEMCRAAKPLWTRNNGKELLNFEEHSRMFRWPQSGSELIRIEATRHTTVVSMNSVTLVGAFLDADKWMELFPSIISRAKTLQIVVAGASGHASGSLHLMYAELQALSPLVPSREAHFLRYCHKNAEEGSWTIVDFPLEKSFHGDFQCSFPRYKRRPSGCIIQDMPNGCSKVTWLEIAEVEDKPVHRIFEQFVYSGMAFGAQRWLAVLQRQCERLASLMATNINVSDLGVIPSPEARKNLMNLAQSMVRTFCVNISTCRGQTWTALSDSADETVRITTRKTTEPGQPTGLILTAVSTAWLPHPHYRVFDMLRDERRRAQLDVLSGGNSLHEVAHIANGSHPGNCISLLRVTTAQVASNSSQSVELMLQESCTDEWGSLVVCSAVDVDAIQQAMSGGEALPSCINTTTPLLPLGFVVVPTNDDYSGSNGNSPPSAGCLLTVGLQVLASTLPTAKLNLSSVAAINNHLINTVHQINAALMGGGGSSCADQPPVSTPPKQGD